MVFVNLMPIFFWPDTEEQQKPHHFTLLHKMVIGWMLISNISDKNLKYLWELHNGFFKARPILNDTQKDPPMNLGLHPAKCNQKIFFVLFWIFGWSCNRNIISTTSHCCTTCTNQNKVLNSLCKFLISLLFGLYWEGH